MRRSRRPEAQLIDSSEPVCTGSDLQDAFAAYDILPHEREDCRVLVDCQHLDLQPSVSGQRKPHRRPRGAPRDCGGGARNAHNHVRTRRLRTPAATFRPSPAARFSAAHTAVDEKKSARSAILRTTGEGSGPQQQGPQQDRRLLVEGKPFVYARHVEPEAAGEGARKVYESEG